MRTFPASVAVIGLLAAALTGCSAPGAQGCARTDAADPAALSTVTVSGPVDSAPEVSVYTPFVAKTAAFEDEVVGEGTQITSDAQLIVLDVSITSGTTGENVVETQYDGDLSRVSTVKQWVDVVPGFEDALMCATEGSRVVVALPPGAITEETATSLGLGADDTAVAVVDVRKVYLGKADGANQFVVGRGLPSVVRAPDGRPGIIVPDSAAPTEVVTETLKKGTGAKVTGEVPVVVHYTGVTWDDPTVFDTTWDGAPKPIQLDSMLPAFSDALIGQTVGSQVLIVIPPDEGYGDQAQGTIPAGSTLVFVVDILGLAPAGAAGSNG